MRLRADVRQRAEMKKSPISDMLIFCRSFGKGSDLKTDKKVGADCFLLSDGGHKRALLITFALV